MSHSLSHTHTIYLTIIPQLLKFINSILRFVKTSRPKLKVYWIYIYIYIYMRERERERERERNNNKIV